MKRRNRLSSKAAAAIAVAVGIRAGSHSPAAPVSEALGAGHEPVPAAHPPTQRWGASRPRQRPMRAVRRHGPFLASTGLASITGGVSRANVNTNPDSLRFTYWRSIFSPRSGPHSSIIGLRTRLLRSLTCSAVDLGTLSSRQNSSRLIFQIPELRYS